MHSVRNTLVVIAATLAVVLFAAPGAAPAQDYDLSFSLPTYGKSGCMVCHGDRNLVRLRAGQSRSYWVDETIIEDSAHAGIMCTGCHLDFSYKAPHDDVGSDWRATAKLMCKNCHEDAYDDYGLGVHSISLEPGEEPDPDAPAKPLCGDCHGAHDIQMLTDNPEGQRELHERGREVCGTCHDDEWDSYDDYYHGAAYKRGAPDAPACWHCHDRHAILPSDDRRSWVSEGRLEATCGQVDEGCHADVSEGFLSYSDLVHNREEALEENPFYGWLQRLRDSISGLFGGIFGAAVSGPT